MTKTQHYYCIYIFLGKLIFILIIEFMFAYSIIRIIKFPFTITSFRHSRIPFKKDDDVEKIGRDHFRWTLAVGHCQSLWDPVVDGRNLERCKRFHSDLPRTLCYDVARSTRISRLRWRNCATTKQEPQEGTSRVWLFMNYSTTAFN